MTMLVDWHAQAEREDVASRTVALRYASPESLFRSEYESLVKALSLGAGLEAAEDAVQDAFVRLYVEWGRISAYENPAAWVRRVAIHRLIDRHRRLGHRARALLRLGPPVVSVDPPRSDHLDLSAAVRLLPPRQRVAVGLFYVADLPVRDVAEAMGISQGAVNRYLHDGRDALRRSLEV